MSCAACAARVEKAVGKVPGVESVAVSLLTNSMGVEGSASPKDIIKAVENAGYGALEKEKEKAQGRAPKAKTYEDSLTDTETPKLKKRLIWSLIFLALLMYLSMGHMMWGWPLPSFFEGNHVAMGLCQLILSAIIMLINQRFFVSGFRSVLHGAPNMDTLVALGSGISFLYSTVVLFLMTGAEVKGDHEAVMVYMHEFYFESAGMILTLITVGKLLEARSKGKTTDALKSLMALTPKTAVVLRDGAETVIPVEEVRSGDLFVVRPGESIPVDGVVLEGASSVNEAALTGESIPVDKGPESTVSAATINQSGFLKCRATRVGEDTTLSQIIQMVSDAQATKAPIAKIADQVSGVFVPVVIGIAVLTFVLWLIIGPHTQIEGAGEIGFARARAISVLVISCPCALGLATPVAIMVGSGLGAKSGILFKTASSLEEAGRSQIVVLDKTGTITKGEPKVTDLLPGDGTSPKELLRWAGALEGPSEHPLAKAIVDEVRHLDAAAEEPALQPLQTEEFQALVGSGVAAVVGGHPMKGGSLSFMEENLAGGLPQKVREKAMRLAEEGKTPLVFSRDGQYFGMIAVADTMKEDSAEAIEDLRRMGIRTVMLTGDNEQTARAIAASAGVDEVVAKVLPKEKEAVVRRLMELGKTIMVGDGINDAPALTAANLGVAIGAGADVALDAADVVLMKSRLKDAVAAIRLSRQTLRNIHENLFWAFIYNVIGIPLAAGLLIGLFGWKLNPMFGAAAMSLSSFCVVTNALRLNFFDPFKKGKDRPRKNEIPVSAVSRLIHGEACPMPEDKPIQMTEETAMVKKMSIEGMMCSHCEMTVKKALEAIDGVREAKVSHEAGEAIVTFDTPVADEVLKKAVEDKEYTVKEIA